MESFLVMLGALYIGFPLWVLLGYAKRIADALERDQRWSGDFRMEVHRR
jgi:hypothetical protein